MNFVPALNSVICHGCAGEFAVTALNESGLCLGCRVDVQMAVEKERALDFQSLSAEALRDSTAAVVARSQEKAKRLESTVYSVKAAS